MEKITIWFAKGGCKVLKNVFSFRYLGDEIHYFEVDMDMGVNHVTVTNQDNVFVREYNTQSFNAI
jgi:hypothetical protein